MTFITPNKLSTFEQPLLPKESVPRFTEKNDIDTNDVFEEHKKISKFSPVRVENKRIEEKFVETIDISTYGVIAKNFMDNYMTLGTMDFSKLKDLLIEPAEVNLLTPKLKMTPYRHEQVELEEWHMRHAYKFAEELLDADEQTRTRHKKREEKGLGLGGRLSTKTFYGKEAGHYISDNLTIRGQMVHLTEHLCGKSVYEILPLYAARKGCKVGMKISSNILDAVVSAAGDALLPVSFGISKVVTNQISTVITLSGEAITGKLLGATSEKIATHAGLRGVQLELPNVLPGGQIIQMYESGAQTIGNLTIAASSIADIILKNISDRYASILSESDLGDERVLQEMNNRIDYLSRFLIPYGQYLYLKAKTPENKKKLLYIIKQELKVLRDLEKTKTKALQFYQLALLAERIPPSRRAGIEAACNAAVPNLHRNTHKIARRCLATLLKEYPVS